MTNTLDGVRLASPADLPAMARLAEAAGGLAWSHVSLANELTRANTDVLVLDEAGVAAGFALLVCAADEAELHYIAIDPTLQKRGMGARLLAAVVAAAKRRDARKLFLEVRADNGTARRLYQRAGFVEIARRAGYYARAGVDAVVMVLSLAEEPTA